MKYKLVVCGGTFDHFHKGHKVFLEHVLSLSEHILIGLTSDKYITEHKNSTVEPFTGRKQAIVDFLSSIDVINRVEIAAIDSVYIPKEWENRPIAAIIVTEESQKGGELINQDRGKRSLNVLPIVLFQMIPADDGLPISSSRIRNGEIDREGKSWVRKKWLAQTLHLPEELRNELKKPFGVLIREEQIKNLKSFDFTAFHAASLREKSFLAERNETESKPSKIITVGDFVTQFFLQQSIHPKISIIDFHIERKQRFTSLKELGFHDKETVFEVQNPAGQLTPELFKTIREVLQEHHKNNNAQFIIKIIGEDDLSVLPLILFLPLGFSLFYGQPKEGMVKVDITEETKEKAYNLVDRFVIMQL